MKAQQESSSYRAATLSGARPVRIAGYAGRAVSPRPAFQDTLTAYVLCASALRLPEAETERNASVRAGADLNRPVTALMPR